MAATDKNSGTYWDLLNTAQRFLDEGDFPEAERLFFMACRKREESPGRVFLTEKIGDGLGRLLQRSSTVAHDGRWKRRSESFSRQFLAEGDQTVRQAVHTAELRPEDDARKNHPLLERALFLVSRSSLFNEEPTSAVPLLKGLFRTARRTGKPFSVDLVRHDLPLTEEDRLWLARCGGELVVEFQEQGAMVAGSDEVKKWARVCLQLLNPSYFGPTARLEEERSWIEAATADHLLGKAAESVVAYRKYLQEYPQPGERADEGRVRLLELLANIDNLHFHVPDYDQALAVMASVGLAEGSAMAGRLEAAHSRIKYRRPDPEPGQSLSPAWASLDLEADGRIAIVYWWQEEPRDVAFWRPGEDIAALKKFLDPCEGRLLAGHASAVEAIGDNWEPAPPIWTARDLAMALLEPQLPAGGLENEALLRLAMGETAAWRAGWNPDHGHRHLEPPRRSTLTDAWHGGPAGNALVAGLLVLAFRARLAQADPCLRAGISHLAKRGDAVASLLYDFVTAGRHDAEAMDLAFQPWTLPLLWTRPDPFGWAAEGRAGMEIPVDPGEGLARPDLGRNDLAIVTTGDPAAVVAAWGGGRQKWRIVLDRLDRLEGLSRVAGGAIGPVTLIPPEGRVHDLQKALEWLETLVDAAEQDGGLLSGLMPLFHWVRLVESHNGDLLDFQEVRPRPGADLPLYQRYVEAVAELPTVEPRLADEGQATEDWSHQFSQRVRKAGFVAGMVGHLLGDDLHLDSLWGVFEGSDASWVFLDSAAVHWSLLAEETTAVEDLHALLHSRGHRHLSLLTGAIWMRAELEETLASWLKVYGSPYRVGLTDGRPPRLKLADRGLTPDSVASPHEALLGIWAHVRNRLLAGEGATLQIPGAGLHALFWTDVALGKFDELPAHWYFLSPGYFLSSGDQRGGPFHRQEEIPTPGRKVLLIPILSCLEGVKVPIALDDTPDAWARADRDRREFLEWRRRLCGLEIAAHLAGGWDEVEILDARWWRLLKPEGLEEGARQIWSGALAADEVASEAALTFDLPGSRADLQVPDMVRAQVNQWVANQPDVDALTEAGIGTEAGTGTDPSRRPVEWAEKGRPRLISGTIEEEWEKLVFHVRDSWDRGDLSTWILLVAHELPSAAGSLVAGSWAGGMSAWPRNGETCEPAPLLWVQQVDFANPALTEYLEHRPPTFILVCGLEQWLPGLHRERQVAAHALRSLLDRKASRLVLQTEPLPEPWWDFLEQVTGGRKAGQKVGQKARQKAEQPALPESVAEFPSDADTEFPGEANTLARLRQLLNRLDDVLPRVVAPAGDQGRTTISARQLMPLRWLALLAGTPEDSIRRGVRILRWAGRLAGDSLSVASGQLESSGGIRTTHALLIPARYAVIQNRLQHLSRHLPVLLPLMLGTHRPGLSTWIDLAYPPAETSGEDLLLLDTYLGMAAGASLPDLTWQASRGFMHTTQRLLACEGAANAALQGVAADLTLFQNRIRDLMGGAVETGDGFLADTGLTDLQPSERNFLATGAAMGLWRWLGPADEDSLHLVDLLTLAHSATVCRDEGAWNLLQGLAGESSLPIPTVPEPDFTPREADTSWTRGLLGPFWRSGERREGFAEVVKRVAELVRTDGQPGSLILRGAMGSGRHEALGRGLAGFLICGEVTVFCPDDEAAAVLLDAVGPSVAAFLNDIRIPPGGSIPSVPLELPGHLQDLGDNLVLMCEVQRFEKETRYRIAQKGRGRKLLMTVDPHATTESWEDLFLTTPRAGEVITLAGSRRHGRDVWQGLSQLLPAGGAESSTCLRAETGGIVAESANNLNHCLARLTQEVDDGTLPDHLRLVGPLLSDLDFLADALREQGWLALPESLLAHLKMPGVRHLLAAATDLLAQGLLDEARQTSPNPPTSGTRRTEASQALFDHQPVTPVYLTSLMLPTEARADWEKWRDDYRPALSDLTMAQFFADIETTAWARTFLAHSEAADRVHRLLIEWADEAIGFLAETPLWEAWWLSTLAELRLPLPRERRPLLTLAAAAEGAGLFAPGSLYLCLGGESWRQHYRVLGRVTEKALVLYKERSPLASEELPPA